MPRLKPQVTETLPPKISESTDYVVLYIRATDNLDAIECANAWARSNKFIRARELTLGSARKNNEDLFVARCYRKAPGER